MSKRFTLKSVFSLIVILLTALVLVACGGEDDQELVNAALDTVAIPFATGDTATSVTQNLVLPTTSGNITISWSSNNPTVISNAGVITRPAVGQNNVTVTLTATLTLGEAMGTKDFTVVVIAMTLTDQQAVDAAVTALAVAYASSDSATSVTGNVTLPTTLSGVTVAWTSSHPTVISSAGIVTRPAEGQPNVTVTLTAALSRETATGSKTFTLVVIAHPVVITDQDKVDAALATLGVSFASGDNLTSVTQNVTLATMSETVSIAWATNNAALSNSGMVTRPAAGQPDVTVVLTATLTLGSATATKEFTLVIKAMEYTDQQLVDGAITLLSVAYASNDSVNSVTSNVVLPTLIGSVAVAWTSSNPAVISNAGVVTRPAAGEANATVTLTAALSKGSATGSKAFTLIVLAHPVIITDQDRVDDAYDTLSVTLAAGDTLAAVTKNVTLVSMSGTVSVTWSSNNAAVISNAGVVTRPLAGQADVTVLLTATLTLNDVTETKVFTVIVKALPYTALDALDMITIEGTTLTNTGMVSGVQSYSTTSNIVLPTLVLGFEVTWISTNPALLSSTGVVVRPAYGQTDSTVILTAMVEDEEVTFIIYVLAITEKPVELILSDARDILLLANIGNGVSTNLTLPAVSGTEGVTVTWESSHPDVLSGAGVVTRQLDNVSVTLTATLHFGGQSVTKEFVVIVLAAQESLLVESVAAALALGAGNYVKILGVTVFGLTTEGFMFGDDTAMLFAYTQIAPASHIVEGGVYDVYGLVDYFNGSMQLNGVKEAEKPIVMVANTEADATVLTPKVVTNVVDYIATLPREYTTASPLVFEYLQLTLKVRVQSTDNYHTMFVNPDYVGGDINTAAQSPFTENALIVYYKSNKAALTPFHDLTITVNVFLYSLRNDRNLYTVIFTGTADDIQVALNDTATVDLAGQVVTQDIPREILANTTLDLPESTLGTVIVWTSSNEAVLDPSTGLVTIPETGQVTVTLTATITKGDVTKAFNVAIKVGELEILTVAEVLLLSSGTVRMHVTVTGMTTYRTFAIQDETGAMAVFYANSTAAQITEWVGYIGKEIEIIGTRGAFGGLQQIILPFTVTVLGDGVIPASVNIDAVPLTVEGMLPYRSMFVTRTGLEVIAKPAQSFGNVLLTLQDPVTLETINMFWDSRVVVAGGNIASFEIGDTVNLIGVPVGWASNLPRFEYTKSTQIIKVEFVPTTDQEKVDAAALALAPLPGTVTSNQTLTLEAAGLYDTVVTWESSNTDVITNAGVVTVPFDQVSVTMTATVTLGDATTTREFVIVVRENVVTIAVARTLAVDVKVIVEGLVTSVAVATDGKVVAFIQDATAGIYLYKIAAADADKVVVGNIIRVYGDAALFNGLVQIDTFTNIVVVSMDNAVVPTIVTEPVLLATMPSELVQVSGYLRQLYTTGSDFFLVTDQGQFQLRLVSSGDLNATDRTAITTKLYNVPMGTYITLVAGVGNFNAVMQLMLFDADDITIGALGTDAELLAAAVGNLVLPAESAELIANITLPTTGLFGTTVAWASNNEAFISTTGVVTRPIAGTSDEMVTMTYTVTLNAEVFEGTLDFTVLAIEEEVTEPEETTVIAAYPGGSSINMVVDTNNATSIGLDPEMFTVSTTLGDASVQVGLNTAGQIRIYGNRATGNGNTLSISIIEGYIITGVSFVFGASTNSPSAALTLGADTQNLLTADLLSVTKAYADLDITSFSIKNTQLNPEGSSNAQIYILQIIITYIEEVVVVVEPITVTAAYPGGTTTNMIVDTNNAAAIGLNPELFNVTTTLGGASVQIGLNTAGQIRIYANRTTGIGNTLTISIAAGYTITGVEFVFGASTNSPTATLNLGDTPVSLLTADLLNVTRTYSSLNIQTFSMMNTQLGGSSNAQIYILSIVITYIQNPVV